MTAAAVYAPLHAPLHAPDTAVQQARVQSMYRCCVLQRWGYRLQTQTCLKPGYGTGVCAILLRCRTTHICDHSCTPHQTAQLGGCSHGCFDCSCRHGTEGVLGCRVHSVAPCAVGIGDVSVFRSRCRLGISPRAQHSSERSAHTAAAHRRRRAACPTACAGTERTWRCLLYTSPSPRD